MTDSTRTGHDTLTALNRDYIDAVQNGQWRTIAAHVTRG